MSLCISQEFTTTLLLIFALVNSDHVMIPRRVFLSKVGTFMLARSTFKETTQVQISWVSSHDPYWENKIDKRKRSIAVTSGNMVYID